MKTSQVLGVAVAASLYSVVSATGGCGSVLVPDYSAPSLAAGWQGQLVVKDLKKPRGVAFDNKGALLVVESGKGVARITFTGDGTCLQVDNQKLLVDNKDLNHGIALSEDGDTLYVSSVSNVFAFPYDADEGEVGNANIVINHMSNNDHTTRTLLMSKKSPGKLVVSRGSDENYDVDALNKTTGLSQIKVFDLNKSKVYNFDTDGALLGWGLRNSVGVAEDPVKGGIWSVENSIDDIKRGDQDIHQNNPAEELNFHGYLNGSTDHQGGNYGYPVCFAVWDAEFPDSGDLKVGDQFSMDSKNDTKCADDYEAPRLALPPHEAPLDIKFNNDGSKAYVTFHGSWDRSAPVGYRLSTLAFKDGEPEASQTSKDSLSDIMVNADLSDCPDKCFRPVGLAWDAHGRLFMSSDSTGEIYVLQQTETSPSSTTSGTIVTATSEPENAGGRLKWSAPLPGIVAGLVGLLLAW